jgi:hypothetical protein
VIQSFGCTDSDCPFVSKPSPRYHVESNLNVPQTLHTKPRKSDRTKQKEWQKNYGIPAVEASKHGFPVDGIAYSARQNQDMIRQVGRTDTIELPPSLSTTRSSMPSPLTSPLPRTTVTSLRRLPWRDTGRKPRSRSATWSSEKPMPPSLQQASGDNKLDLELGQWMTKKASVYSIMMKTTTMQHLWKMTSEYDQDQSLIP